MLVTVAYRLQLAALRDDRQASVLAEQTAARFGEAADVVFDADTGLFKVLMGRYAGRGDAEARRGELERRGLEGVWITSTGLGPDAHLVLVGGPDVTLERTLVVETANGTVRVAGRRYRGRLVIYLNDRGRLNLINEIFLEDYLRGVVPMELGPELYPELEALKAQTVAARTYTVMNLSGFESEGFDICATPRCQVYGGLDAEHPRSDEAVRGTLGEVLTHTGHLAEALYSSTCGGITEHVEVVFPERRGAHLRPAFCVERAADQVSGRAGARDPVGAVALAMSAGDAPGPLERSEARLRSLARMLDLPAGRDELRSLQRDEVDRFVLSLLDLILDRRLLGEAAESASQLGGPSRRVARALRKNRSTNLGEDGVSQLAVALALELGLYETRAVQVTQIDQQAGLLVARDEEGTRDLELTVAPSLFARTPQGSVESRSQLLIYPGDRVVLHQLQDQLVALEMDAERAVERPSASQYSSWQRFRSDTRLQQLVAKRYPGFEMNDLEILERGASGRVARMRLTSSSGESVDVAGLAVRWTLDLPDTWFSARRVEQGSRRGWTFRGRGLGHGVGMCQVGAYAMAKRGSGYRDILTHYYDDVRIEKWPTRSELQATFRDAGASR